MRVPRESTDNRPIIQHNRPITRPNPRIIYRRFSGNYRSGRKPLPLTDNGRPAAPARTMANNLSSSYHQTVGIYQFVRGPGPDALHQAGRRAEAEIHFREAENMQAQINPNFPLLCTLQCTATCCSPPLSVPRGGKSREPRS
jgi:hypothetical protein